MLHQIGNGALGPVFRAYDQDRDRLVAVKLFRLDLPPERVHQLVSEFEKLIGSDLQHPVVASPRATGIVSNSAYLAQDFAAADSLDVVIRENGAAPPAQAVRVAGQLAEALDYAADRQIVHGALHPRDILLSQEDIRIVGLGVARALERVGVNASVRRPYAAPERINDGGWDRSADVFSLAAVVFELLCGKRVAGTGSEAAESMPEIPGADNEALQRVFALALAADPSYRYPTATAFTDALKDAMGIEIAPERPKAKRRPKLRVVALPLEEVLEVPEVPEVLEVPEVPEVQEVLEVQEAPVLEVPEVDAEAAELAEIAEAPLPVRKPRRRKAPAPTPVAIETVAQLPALSEVEGSDAEIPFGVEGPEPELVIEPLAVEPEMVAELPVFLAPLEETPVEELPVEEVPVIEEAVIEEAVVEAAQMPVEFVPVEQPEPEPVPEPELFSSLEPEPLAVSEVEEGPELFANPERSSNPERFPNPEPPAPSPIFIAAPPQHSPVWPVGVAAVIGIALGFGAGYTVAIRDRAAVSPPVAVAAPPPALPQVAVPETTVVVAPQPVPESVSSPPVAESLAKPAPKPAVSPKPPVNPEAGKAEPAVFAGRVLVRSTPPGARVFVDGNDRGQTPATIRELSQGEHRIRVARDGYAAVERRVVVSSAQPSQSLSIPLKRETQKGLAPPKANTQRSGEAGAVGSLIVESRPPGAAVIIDGRRVGTTPMSLGDLRTGSHAVRLERDGYRVWTSGISISAGDQNRITASLEK